MPSRTDTAQIGVHRTAQYSLYFSNDCEIFIKIQDFKHIDFTDVFEAYGIRFDLVACTAEFNGIAVASGKWIVGTDAAPKVSIQIPASPTEIRYVLRMAEHLFTHE